MLDTTSSLVLNLRHADRGQRTSRARGFFLPLFFFPILLELYKSPESRAADWSFRVLLVLVFLKGGAISVHQRVRQFLRLFLIYGPLLQRRTVLRATSERLSTFLLLICFSAAPTPRFFPVV